MKSNFYVLLAFTIVIPVAGTAAQGQVTPVQKVLELLTGMVEKGKKSKAEEEVQFSAYAQWCGDTKAEKAADIEEAEMQIKELQADIAKLTSDAATLATEIKDLESDISKMQGEIKAATAVRRQDRADYEAMHQDYSESIDAIERAIAVLKKQTADVPQAALMQLKYTSLIPQEAQKAIDKFLQQDPSLVEENLEAGLVADAPEANAYENQSGGIIEMLEKLLDKFMDKRTTLEKEELSSKSAYNVMVIDLKGQIAQAEQDLAEKKALKAQKLEDKAAKEAQLAETISTMNADKKYLADVTAECAQKTSDFEDRQALRAQEIATIEKAIEIISSDTVSGAAEKHLPSLLQKKAASALVQLRASGGGPSQLKASQFLRDQAQRLQSHVLLSVAERVEDDPFKKVKRMIKELIVKLMEEAGEEANHKAYCDAELATNAQTRKEKTEEIEMLTAEIDQLQASIAQLAEDIKELNDAVAALDKAMAQATKIRSEEKAKNTETTADAVAAQKAVTSALAMLKEFYANAADATALVQAKQPDIFDSPEKGMQGQSTGVIGILEVILSDFARLEAETTAAERQAQKEYDAFMTDSSADKAAKNADIDFKTEKMTDQKKTLKTNELDKADTQEELDAAMAYFDKLKPSCVSAGVDYDERVEQRKAEIQSLKEALQILNGEDIP